MNFALLDDSDTKIMQAASNLKLGKSGINIKLFDVKRAIRPDGSLILLCEVKYLAAVSDRISAEAINHINQGNGQVPTAPKEDFVGEDGDAGFRARAMGEMLKNGLYADCTIVVGEKRIPAHRCILSSHSEMFHTMFEATGMLETRLNVVEITDFEPAAVIGWCFWF